jgi:hypothetical protein
MKKYLFLGLFLILITRPPFAFADNTQTGNASAQSSATTTTNGSNCSTHIEVTVNGQTQVLDSTDCGTHTLNKTANGTTEESSPRPSITKPVLRYPRITVSQIPTATPTPTIMGKNRLQTPSLFSVVVKGVEALFKRFFHAF